MQILLVEKNNKRFVGEFDESKLPMDPETNEKAEIGDMFTLHLKNAYELVRMNVMGQNGPELRHMFMPIGVEGAHDWTVEGCDGFREVSDLEPLTTAYRSERAADSGIVLAGASGAPGGGGIVSGRIKP